MSSKYKTAFFLTWGDFNNRKFNANKTYDCFQPQILAINILAQVKCTPRGEIVVLMRDNVVDLFAYVTHGLLRSLFWRDCFISVLY